MAGGEDLELDASVDGLEADGEMQLRATNLEEEEITFRGRLWPTSDEGKQQFWSARFDL